MYIPQIDYVAVHQALKPAHKIERFVGNNNLEQRLRFAQSGISNRTTESLDVIEILGELSEKMRTATRISIRDEDKLFDYELILDSKGQLFAGFVYFVEMENLPAELFHVAYMRGHKAILILYKPIKEPKEQSWKDPNNIAEVVADVTGQYESDLLEMHRKYKMKQRERQRDEMYRTIKVVQIPIRGKRKE